MIWLYSGTPGSGKSYHAVADAVKKLGQRSKNRVIANFPLQGKRITARFESGIIQKLRSRGLWSMRVNIIRSGWRGNAF